MGDTITIKEFKALVPADSKDRMKLTRLDGKLGLSTKVQTKQCENLKVGDTVFFLNATYRKLSKDNIPEVDVVITQATVVDEPVEGGDENSGSFAPANELLKEGDEKRRSILSRPSPQVDGGY